MTEGQVSTMQTGAVILADGNITKDGNCAPLRKIGMISALQRIVSTLHQAGITRILTMTGAQAEDVEYQLKNSGLVFLRNDENAQQEPMDTVRKAVRVLMEQCSRVLLVPASFPLFCCHTVQALMEPAGGLVVPEYRGEPGFPVAADRHWMEILLQQDGERLEEVLLQFQKDWTVIEVDDAGIGYNAESDEEYGVLVEDHNRQMMRPEIQVTLSRERPFFNEKTALLLRLVGETSSVRRACMLMNISYTTGWNLIRTLENQLRCPFINRTQGGARGGTSILTEQGKALVECYDRYTEQIFCCASELYEEIFEDVLRQSETDTPGTA